MYAFSWMDSGVTYHFASGGRLLVLLTFAGAVAVAAAARKVGWVLWFAMLGSAAFNGFPLEMVGGLLTLTYSAWVLGVAMTDRKQAMLPTLGFLGLGAACMLGFPRTYVAAGEKCRGNMRNLALCAQMYESDFQQYPGTLDQLVGASYLRKLPECGSGRSAYRLESSGQRCTLYCESGLHPPKDPPTPYAVEPLPSATPRK